MDSQAIQTGAAVIQAFGSIVFLGTVLYGAKVSKDHREQERRDNLICALHKLYVQTKVMQIGMTPEEQSGFYSERMIEFFNSKLLERGEKWTFGG
jgi:hypothetical protein